MKTSLFWFRAVVTLCLVALFASCSDLTHEETVLQDKNRAEVEALVRQYGLQVFSSCSLPKTATPIRLSSPQALREFLAKYYVRNDWNRRRSRYGDTILDTTKAMPNNWCCYEYTPTPPSLPVLPPPYYNPGPSGPTDNPVPGGPTDNPGGPYTNPADPGDPAKFFFGNAGSANPSSLNPGRSNPLTNVIPLVGGIFTPHIVTTYQYTVTYVGSRDNGRFIVKGAKVELTATGGLENQVKPIETGSTGYETADGGFHVSALMSYTYRLGGQFGTVEVGLPPRTDLVQVTFTINPDGTATQPVLTKIN